MNKSTLRARLKTRFASTTYAGGWGKAGAACKVFRRLRRPPAAHLPLACRQPDRPSRGRDCRPRPPRFRSGSPIGPIPARVTASGKPAPARSTLWALAARPLENVTVEPPTLRRCKGCVPGMTACSPGLGRTPARARVNSPMLGPRIGGGCEQARRVTRAMIKCEAAPSGPAPGAASLPDPTVPVAAGSPGPGGTRPPYR
jgi:hypothetical protein